jgi:hypothetical protein
MRTNAWLAAACALVALSGCASATTSPGRDIQHQRITRDSAAVCTAQKCKVDIVVADDCTVEARPYYLIMVGKAPVTVTWTTSKNATFVREGIFFKEAEGRKSFARDARLSGKTEIVYENDKRDGIYHYGVRAAVGDRECPVLDPGTINDMGTQGEPGGIP